MTASIIAAIIGALTGVANAVVSFLTWLHEQQLVQSGIVQQQLSDLKAQVDAAHDAVKIRELQRIADERDGVPKHGEFDRDK